MAGSYVVTVKDANACVTNKSVIVYQKKRRHNYKLVVYPNPTTTYFKASIVDEKSFLSADVKVMNAFGCVVYRGTISNNNTTIFGQNFPAGVYWIQFKIDNEVEVKKVIKQ